MQIWAGCFGQQLKDILGLYGLFGAQDSEMFWFPHPKMQRCLQAMFGGGGNKWGGPLPMDGFPLPHTDQDYSDSGLWF